MEATVEKIVADTGVSRATVHKVGQEIDALEQQIETARSQADLNNVSSHLKDVLIRQGKLDVQKAEIMLELLRAEARVYENNPNLKKLEVGARAGGGTFGLQGAIGTAAADLLTVIEEVYNNAEKTGQEIVEIIERKMQEISTR